MDKDKGSDRQKRISLVDDIKLLDELRSLAVSITNQPDLIVKISDTEPVSYILDNTITLTTRTIPKNIDDIDIKMRILDGEIIHESIHYLISHPIRREAERFIDSKRDYTLAWLVVQLVEDTRVYNYGRLRYPYDFNIRLELLRDILRDSDIEVNRRYRSLKNNERYLIALIQRTLFNKKTILYNTLNSKQRKSIERVRRLLDSNKHIFSPDRLYDLYEKIYSILSDNIDRREEIQIEQIPYYGGDLKYNTKKLDTLKKKIEHIQTAIQRRDIEKKGDPLKNIQIYDSIGAGSGEGLRLPSPKPDREDYLRRYYRLEHIVKEILRRLRTNQYIKLEKEEFRKKGRMMSEIVSKYYPLSLTRKIENIYEGYIETLKSRPMKIAIIVDISASMNLDMSKDLLVILTEVFGRYLRESDFMILAYTSDYYKIKSLEESYKNTRYRIGGLHDQRGTVLYNPLLETYRIFKSLRQYRRIVIIGSDFEIEKREDTANLIRQMERDNIDIIGIAYGKISFNIDKTIRRYRIVNDLSLLPHYFIDLLEEVLRGGE